MLHSDLVPSCVLTDMSPQIETRASKEFCDFLSLAPLYRPHQQLHTHFTSLYGCHLQSDLSPSLFRFWPCPPSPAAARLRLSSISRAKCAAVPDTSSLRK